MNFKTGKWNNTVDLRDFVFLNSNPYDGNESFLQGPTGRTRRLWSKCQELFEKETNSYGGVLDIDTETISTITSHGPGYISKKDELIFGLQTDEPLKRAIKPFGGIKVSSKACSEYKRKINPEIENLCTQYRKTHNDGVFDAYTPEIKTLRSLGIITGLPDNYARGRIIGDYRRVALYGIDLLIRDKEKDKSQLHGPMTNDIIQLREEISEQIKALRMMKEMAQSYGFDISQPANNAKEAIQWTYFAYLSALKEHDGAAMSLSNVSIFFDIYLEKDIEAKTLTEIEAQELVDQFIIKLRLVRQLRTTEYDELFAGDPVWLTESIGGIWQNGQHKVAKTSYRFLQSLYNLGPSPEPNLTILWSEKLPENFKNFCAKVSIDTSSLQYENDDLMRHTYSYDDYAISCCVSYQKCGKMMQFFGARCNLAKVLLLAINSGRDEVSGKQILDSIPALKSGPLDFKEVSNNYQNALKQISRKYVDTMNIIHYMHDKYYYERAQMALLDSKPERIMAFGAAGLSVVADSFSAIKYAKVTAKRDKSGLSVDFESIGDFPKYGNDDDRADSIANGIVSQFSKELLSQYVYREAKPTLSILTITSNIVYGKITGATPDGRKAGQPFAPGANPMHSRDTNGAIASLNSVAKLNYKNAKDGISNTFTVTPSALGKDIEEQVENLVSLLEGYFIKKAHHLNVNVLNRETLLEAIDHPEKYPQLTIRISGYAVNFTKLSPDQQKEVLSRTFFERF